MTKPLPLLTQPGKEVQLGKEVQSSIKFLRFYIDTRGITESIKTDQLSGFKGRAMDKLCLDNNIEQKFRPVFGHCGCGLVDKIIQTN